MKVLSNMTQHPPTVQNIKILYQYKPNNVIHYYSFSYTHKPTLMDIITKCTDHHIFRNKNCHYVIFLHESWQSYFILLFSIWHILKVQIIYYLYMTYSTSVRRKLTTSSLKKVLSYMYKTGPFTKTLLVFWIKDMIFTCIGKNFFIYSNKIQMHATIQL